MGGSPKSMIKDVDVEASGDLLGAQLEATLEN